MINKPLGADALETKSLVQPLLSVSKYGLNGSDFVSNASAPNGLFIIVIVSNILTHHIGFCKQDILLEREELLLEVHFY